MRPNLISQRLHTVPGLFPRSTHLRQAIGEGAPGQEQDSLVGGVQPVSADIGLVVFHFRYATF